MPGRWVLAVMLVGSTAPAATQEPPRAHAGDSLFASRGAMQVTLATDLRTLLKDRTGRTPYRDAVIIVPRENGGSDSIPARVRTGGIFRRSLAHCDFPPLHVRYHAHDAHGTVFAHHSRLKLTTHCQPSHRYEQYVLQEYRLYLLLNVLTPLSFRARLARITYVDRVHPSTPFTAIGFFLEDVSDVAERNGAQLVDVKGAEYSDLDPVQLDLATWFDYMIGNSDWSIPVLHNVELVRDTAMGHVFPIPYDFDFSGVIDASYAAPDPRLGIATVRDRIYRGRCGAPEQFQPTFDRFIAARASIAALYDDSSGIDAGRRKEIAKYYDDFYRTIGDRGRLEGEIRRHCK